MRGIARGIGFSNLTHPIKGCDIVPGPSQLLIACFMIFNLGLHETNALIKNRPQRNISILCRLSPRNFNKTLPTDLTNLFI